MNSTFDKKQEDDDFDDFQLASGTSASELSSSNKNGTLNWQGEVNKMKTLPNTPTTAESFKVLKSQPQVETKTLIIHQDLTQTWCYLRNHHHQSMPMSNHQYQQHPIVISTI